MADNTEALPPLPERDTSKPAEQQGLFRKFIVTRTDGSSEPGGKHEHCEYFVLDVDHDPHAAAALAAYADAVERTHPELAADMRQRYALAQRQQVPPLSEDEVRRLWDKACRTVTVQGGGNDVLVFADYLQREIAQRQRVPTTAWLVEWRFNGVQWLYLWSSAPGGFSFTSDASKALRFARREDAEAALQWARDTDAVRRPIGSLTRQGLALGEMLVTEHDWPALTAAPSVQRQQMPDKPILDRESTWWALAMGAAASLEDAANCLRDPDAKKAARGAALHVRRQCAALTAAPSAQAEPVAFYKQSDAEPPPRTPRLQGPNG